jgi:hypothetical protein
MSVQATGMLDAVFVEHVPTLGEIVLAGKRKSLETPNTEAEPMSRRSLLDGMAATLSPPGHDLAHEREDHLHLIHLLGDPLLRIKYPIPMEFEVPEKVSPSETLLMQGYCPIDGELHVELVLRRDRTPKGLQARASFDNTPDGLAAMEEAYRQANHLTIYEVKQPITKGDFRIEIPIPSEARGQHAIRAFVSGREQWASGSRILQVKSNKASKGK